MISRSSESLAEALGLRRSGSEFKGPCPVCGGDDRFHVKTGRERDVLFYCRHGCKYAVILAELERRGLIERGLSVKPQYKKDDLETADFLIAIMGAALRRGDKGIKDNDDQMIRALMLRVDPGRAEKLRSLREKLR